MTYIISLSRYICNLKQWGLRNGDLSEETLKSGWDIGNSLKIWNNMFDVLNSLRGLQLAILGGLPADLRRDIQCHLYFDLVRWVCFFQLFLIYRANLSLLWNPCHVFSKWWSWRSVDIDKNRILALDISRSGICNFL